MQAITKILIGLYVILFILSLPAYSQQNSNEEYTELMIDSIYLNSDEDEFEADAHSAEYLSKSGYHPAGLKAYLRKIEIIENIKNIKNNTNNQKQTNKPNLNYMRHPDTGLRIMKIDEVIESKGLRQNKVKVLNKNLFNTIIEKSNGELNLTPKVKKIMGIVQKVIEHDEFYDAQGITNPDVVTFRTY